MATFMGEWKLVNGGTTALGTEKWKLEETVDSIIWNSVIEKSVPFPHKEELHLTVVPRKWQVRTMKIISSSERGDERFEGKRVNGRFEVEIHRSRGPESLSIPVSDSTEFDYLSPAFNTITFHRLRLRRGQTKEIEVVYVFPVSEEDSFQTRMVRQRYQRLSDETVTVQGGRFPSAKHYVYKNLESGWTSSIWTDNLETVLRYEKLCELLDYKRAD